jgi:peptidoglycan/xylan/chitin deacetylase (PgdA/CDA1 family)
MFHVPILTYHSQSIRGDGTANNDHVALAADLRELDGAGFRVVPLDWLTDVLDGERRVRKLHRAVVLTFDDGCDFDVRDLEFPDHGPQRSFLGILEDFRREAGAAARHLHATTFVIASRAARRVIDTGSLFGRGWISDDWWRETDRGGRIAVENHGWDHNHPDLAGEGRGGFQAIETYAQCLEQVVRAAGAIEARTGRWPRYFAYPFGESSDYIRDIFFPQYTDVHGCRAALGTEPGPVTSESSRWNLPRYVCGRDWTAPEGLLDIVKAA